MLVLIAGALVVVILVQIDDEVVAEGTVHPDVEVEVHSLLSGVIVKVHQEAGAAVQEGTTLVSLDDKAIRDSLLEAERELAEARASLETARTNLEKRRKDPLPAELRHADVRLEESKERLRRAAENLARKQQLFDEGLISSEELEQARSEHKLAQLGLQVARKNFNIVNSGLEDVILKEAEASVRQIEQEIDSKLSQIGRLKESLARTRITSPLAGTLVRMRKQDGEAVAAGELVAVIAQSDRFRVTGWVAERYGAKLELGQPAEIYSSQFDYRTFGICKGVVDKTDHWAEDFGETGPFSKAYQVEIAVTEAPFQPRLNSRAQARIKVGRKRLIKYLLGWD